MKVDFKRQIERCSIECQMYLDLGKSVNQVTSFFENKYPDLMIEIKQKKDGSYVIEVC